MNRFVISTISVSAMLPLVLATACERVPAPEAKCPANLDRQMNSILIRNEGYADMPYMVQLPSGHIGMTMTVSGEHEGSGDQHSIWLVSHDQGQTWSQRSMVEPDDPPKASWAMPFMHDGKLHVVYLYNTRNVRTLPSVEGKKPPRVGAVFGDIAIKTSSDEGITWSERKLIPIPSSEIDRRNAFAGEERLLWLSGAPVQDARYVYFGFSKVGVFPEAGWALDTASFILRSAVPADPSSWELLPPEGIGLGDDPDVTEEPNLVILDDGRFLVTSRTVQGKILQSVSSDGKVWRSDWARYSNGSPLPNPRADAPVHKLANGDIFIWYHNNDGRDFKGRNPVYASCLKKSGKRLSWSKPKMLMCDARENIRVSYPSFLEVGETLLVAETSKREVRVHRFHADKICR